MNDALAVNAECAASYRTPMQALDLAPSADEVRAEVITAIAGPQKMLPSKLFYDEHGSGLFDKICELPEYYPTRTELGIMRDYATEIAFAIGPRALIVEYGSGSSIKTRILLDHLRDAVAYVPIDISGKYLVNSAAALQQRYPDLSIFPVCADYTRPLVLPDVDGTVSARIVAYFPGSTIGNLEPAAARAFLTSIRTTCGRESGLLIGVDLKKSPSTIHAAYNDAHGVTAAFNLNILRRLNHEIGSNFELDTFCHYAFYNPSLGRVEMHLVSEKQQHVFVPGIGNIRFDEGETIHTENCYKYTLQEFTNLAADAGYRRKRVWWDAQNWFSVQFFEGEG
ncbi:MAG: methyltransferase [Chthoniobacteraceae bacterium]|nr:methyltransferase [Chthoniobacteraceae bacterium]